MRFGIIAALVAGAACVQADPKATCSVSSQCGAGRVCDSATHLCVLPSAPLVEVDHPTSVEVWNGSIGHVTGTISSPDGVPVTATYSRAGQSPQPISILASGAFDLPVTLPALDGQTTRIDLVATDASGNETRATIFPLVDDVPPTVMAFPIDGSTDVAPEGALIFSEIVQGPASAAQLIPDAGVIAWNADQSMLRVSQLLPDTAYSLSISSGALTDLAGNPLDGGVTTGFVTAPVGPSDGTTLNLGASITDFDAVSDEDGVITLVAVLATTPPVATWGTFDRMTGLFSVRGNLASDASGTPSRPSVHAVAAAMPRSNMAPLRTAGAYTSISQSFHNAGWYQEGSSSVLGGVADALIPEPSACTEPSANVGYLVTDGGILYERGSTPVAALAISPQWIAIDSRNHWEVFASSGSSVLGQSWQCRCSAGCVLTPVIQVAPTTAGTPFSVALTQTTRRLYAYQTSTGSVDDCHDCPDGGLGSCRSVYVNNDTTTQVASMHSGGKVLRVRIPPGATQDLELWARDLSADAQCGSWTLLGNVTGANASEARAVMAGPRPAAIYLGGDHNLHVFVR